MKNAIIFHGISSTPNSFWFPYLEKELKKKKFDVWVPELPQPDDPDVNIYVPWVLKNGTITKDTILVGHSSGASLILGILDAIKVQIPLAILVSGFIRREGTRPKKIVKEQSTYNWKNMRKRVQRIVFINAANDPWGCNDAEGRILFDHFGGDLLIINQDGHMGSDYYKQPYKQFPLLLTLVDLFTK